MEKACTWNFFQSFACTVLCTIGREGGSSRTNFGCEICHFFRIFFSIYLLEDLVFCFFEALQIAFNFFRRESCFEFPPKTPLFSRFFCWNFITRWQNSAKKNQDNTEDLAIPGSSPQWRLWLKPRFRLVRWSVILKVDRPKISIFYES